MPDLSCVWLQIVLVLTAVLVVGWVTRKYVPRLARPVFLIDTYTYKPPDRMKVSRENYIRGARMRKVLTPSSSSGGLLHFVPESCFVSLLVP